MDANSTVSPVPLENATCTHTFPLSTFIHASIAPAALIMLILAFQQKRLSRLECCKGHPGLLRPMRFMDGYTDRWAYAWAFGATTNNLISLFYGSSSTFVPANLPPWSKAFIVLFIVLEICVSFYPLFACLATPHKLLGSILGALYGTMWLVVPLIHTMECPFLDKNDLEAIFLNFDIKYEGLILQWPAFLCLTLVIAKFIQNFYIAAATKKYFVKENQEMALPHHIRYVRELVRHPKLTPIEGQGCCSSYHYAPVPGFRYPSRVLAMMIVSMCFLYQILVISFYVGSYLFRQIRLINEKVVVTGQFEYTNESREIVADALHVANIWWLTDIVITFVITTSSLYLVLRNYRVHCLKLYRGDKLFLVREFAKKPQMFMADSMRWAGYQVAFMAWGFLVCHVTMFIFGLSLIYAIYIPIRIGAADVLLTGFLTVLAPASVTISVFIVEIAMSKLVFLQPKIHTEDENNPLALDNRRGYDNVCYYTFMYNITIGIAASVGRLIQSLVLGAIHVSRIDHSVLMSGYEIADVGYNSYTGMMYADYTHNHPVLRVFCKLIHDTISHSISRDGCCSLLSNNSNYGSCRTTLSTTLSTEDIDTPLPSESRAKRRWFVAYTMIHNPELIKARQSFQSSSTNTTSTSKADLSNSQQRYRHQVILHKMSHGDRPDVAHRNVSPVPFDFQLSVEDHVDSDTENDNIDSRIQHA